MLILRMLVLVMDTAIDVMLMWARFAREGRRHRERKRHAGREGQHGKQENKAMGEDPHSIFGSAARRFRQARARGAQGRLARAKRQDMIGTMIHCSSGESPVPSGGRTGIVSV